MPVRRNLPSWRLKDSRRARKRRDREGRVAAPLDLSRDGASMNLAHDDFQKHFWNWERRIPLVGVRPSETNRGGGKKISHGERPEKIESVLQAAKNQQTGTFASFGLFSVCAAVGPSELLWSPPVKNGAIKRIVRVLNPPFAGSRGSKKEERLRVTQASGTMDATTNVTSARSGGHVPVGGRWLRSPC